MGVIGVSRQGRLATALLGLVLLLLSAGCASSKGDLAEVQRLQARAAYDRAVNHLNRREMADAYTALQEAIAIDGAVAVYHDVLGLVLLQVGRPEMALERFQKAAELEAVYGDFAFHVGTAYSELARWEEAVGAYRKALSLPTLTVPHLAHQNMGLALFHLKRYREAEESLRFALSLEPRLQAPYYHLGLLFAAEGRTEEAQQAFRLARDLGPDSPFGRAAAERLQALGGGG
jgi:tetratricopeptide (TPR) repeat protein